MDQTTALSRVDAGSLTIQERDDHNVFRLFRTVFDARHCRSRKVYWVEYRRGQTILRQVLNPKRTTKREDKLIGMFRGEPDLDVVRLAIASANARQILTGVRWEIYGDFACTQLLASGRFDHFDLLDQVDPDRLRALLQFSAITCNLNPDDWDFDGILLTHRCPRCRRAYGKEVLSFLPGWMDCERCGYHGNESGSDAVELAARLHTRLITEVEGIHFVPEPAAVALDTPIYFLDIHATPLLCWMFAHYYHGAPLRGWREREIWAPVGQGNFTFDRIERCYRRSIFPLLDIEAIRATFEACIRSYYDRRIADVRERSEFPISRFGTLEDARAFALRSWEESRERFARSLETIRGLGDWMFGPSMDERVVRDGRDVAERSSRIRGALIEFSSCTEELVEHVGKQLIGGEP